MNGIRATLSASVYSGLISSAAAIDLHCRIFSILFNKSDWRDIAFACSSLVDS